MLPDEVAVEADARAARAGEQLRSRSSSSSSNSNNVVDHQRVTTRNDKESSNGLSSPINEEADAAYLANEKREIAASYFSGQNLIWRNVIMLTLFHMAALYSFITFPYIQRWKTGLWAWAVAVSASFGVGAGVHRLWTHRSYKAKTPLRIILMFCYCTAGMNSIYDWVRDHRVHHKYSETDADPHNSNRGFFFSHVGWLMLRKHPEVRRKGRQIDMSDILADPVVAFSEKYFILLRAILCFILPTLVPVYLWNEDWYYAIISQICMRYSYVLNATWCVNSVAHMFGWRPYDKKIAPVENMLISWATGGEGWHNYHHVFPWDYKAAEMGHIIDLSTIFINTFAKIGWAYDLKQSSPELIKSVVMNKGDGTHFEVPPPADEIIESNK